MLPMDKWCRIILRNRILLAVLSNFGVSCMVLSLLTSILNLSTNRTFQIQQEWMNVSSLRMWCNYLLLFLATLLQGLVCIRKYINHPTYWKNRFSSFCGIFVASNLSICALHILIGGILMWLYLSLGSDKYNHLSAKCDTLQGSCLVEEHFFLLLGGFWSGLCFFMKTFFTVEYLKFPIIPLTKFTQFKRRFGQMLSLSVITSIWPTLYLIPVYYVLGSYYRTMILSITFLKLETKPLDCLSRLLNLSLIIHLFIGQLIFAITMNSMYMLLEIYLTEWKAFEFKMNKTSNVNDREVTLIEALSTDKVPIIQHLGYYDLTIIARLDKTRRSLLFILSQPGGHPYHWNSVITECLSTIDRLSTNLNAPFPFVKKEQTPSTLPTLPDMRAGICRQEQTYHMRNLAVPKVPLQDTTDVNDMSKESIITTLIFNKVIKEKWKNFITHLMSKPIIQYVFGEQEENKIDHVLFIAQAVNWAVEAISTFAVVSIEEDSYGIVQKDLPKIISTLLTLKQALDKVQKSSMPMRKQHKEDKLRKQTLMSLRSTTKRNLYKIVCAFEPYIMDLALDANTIEKLQSFLSYKE